MCQKVLFIKLLLVHYATQSQPNITANCNEDVTLRCPGIDADSMDFLSIAWYKFEPLNSSNKLGIIRRAKVNKTPQYYNFTRSPKPEFKENHSLLLRSVTAADSGTYECDISANVGGQNRNLRVDLTVHVCATQADLTTMPTVLNTTEKVCPLVEDLPVMWSIIGYVAVGLAKIALSLICIWVIQAARTRSSRRRQHKW